MRFLSFQSSSYSVVALSTQVQSATREPQADINDIALCEGKREFLTLRDSLDHLNHEDATVIAVVLYFGGVGDHFGADCLVGRRAISVPNWSLTMACVYTRVTRTYRKKRLHVRTRKNRDTAVQEKKASTAAPEKS